MPISQILTATVIGLNAYKITVEVDTNQSIPSMAIVGLPDIAISEAKERVRAAIKNSGYDFPNKKIIVNLAPADIRKEGSNYDLPIALGILVQEGVIEQESMNNMAFVGELSLDGSIRGVKGVLPIVLGLKELGISEILVPKDNVKEAALIPDVKIFGAVHLTEVVEHLNKNLPNHKPIPQVSVDVKEFLNNIQDENFIFDFKDVKGQQKAKRALEIAAAGGHNVLMSGPPGSGKTLLSKCFASILPPLEIEEAIELTKIYSVSGLLDAKNPLITKRPFRLVHHTASAIGIIGGGSNPKPGEITLAHRGVLFLDEIVEFPRNVLEVLRQPLEDAEIVISRAQMRVKFPADFILLAAMNPCPCGYLGDTEHKCTCNEFQITRYRSKLSGPLLDRIDIQIEVPKLKVNELLGHENTGESSADIKKRVVNARKMQTERYRGLGIFTNSELTPKLVKKYCKLNEESEMLLKSAITRFNISGRAYDRLVKLARTIADLEASSEIQSSHIAQAIQYRSFIETTKVKI